MGKENKERVVGRGKSEHRWIAHLVMRYSSLCILYKSYFKTPCPEWLPEDTSPLIASNIALFAVYTGRFRTLGAKSAPMQQPQQAYNLLLEISEEMRPLSYQRKIVEEQFLYDVFTRKDTGRTSVAVKNLEYTSVTHEALQQMSAVAALFVVREILPQIKMYNMLWHRPVSKKSHERAIISELLREKIIFRTETTGIYLVNPIKIWRGNPITSVEATKDLLRTHRKPSLDIIKDLRPGDKYERTSEEHMRSIERDGFHPKLLS